MTDITRIEWADATWNPITGCTPISEGCKNCYAKRMATRLQGRYGYPEGDPFAVTHHPDKMTKPIGWRKSRRVFVCSMGDLFHENVPTSWICDVWAVIAILAMHEARPPHQFLLLTKRAKSMYDRVRATNHDRFTRMMISRSAGATMELGDTWADLMSHMPYPLPNVWLGVTAENQQRAHERLPWLMRTPAVVRYVSVEPMLGPVDLSNHLAQLDWVIVGGETGPGARPMDPSWARSLRDQCRDAGVPFFFKKMGGGRETPPDLAIRELKRIYTRPTYTHTIEDVEHWS